MMLFLLSWWKAGVGILVGLALMWPIAQWAGERKQFKRDEAAKAVAIATALATDSAAKEKAATERLWDAQVVAAKQKELTDAVAALPDENPTVRDVALACQQLRQQGSDVSNVPACGGPAGSPQAPAANQRPGQ